MILLLNSKLIFYQSVCHIKSLIKISCKVILFLKRFFLFFHFLSLKILVLSKGLAHVAEIVNIPLLHIGTFTSIFVGFLGSRREKVKVLADE